MSSLGLVMYFAKNLRRESPFFAFKIASEMCFLKDNFSSRYKPKCLVTSSLATGIPLKERGG